MAKQHSQAVDPQRASAWSRYWASGISESFLGTEDERAKELRSFWNDVFSSFSANATVLDVATGNGILLKLAAAQLPRCPGQRWTGVDLSMVSPTWPAALPEDVRARLAFVSGVNVEELPYPNQSFDAVISQFGIEYTAAMKSLPEVRRVLKVDGCIAFLVHAKDSLILQTARKELVQLDWLIEFSVIELARRMCSHAAKAATDIGRSQLAKDELARKDREQFNETMNVGAAKLNADPELTIISSAFRLVAQAVQYSRVSGQTDGALAMLADAEAQWRDMRFRHQELLDCACDVTDLETFAACLDLDSFVIGSVHDTSHRLLGLTLRGLLRRE